MNFRRKVVFRHPKFLIFFLFTFDTTYSQIINIEKTDSIILNKKKELKEGNNVFYKNEYSLIVYNKENISYNNKNGFTYKVFAASSRSINRTCCFSIIS